MFKLKWWESLRTGVASVLVIASVTVCFHQAPFYVVCQVKAVSFDLESKICCFPELQITSSCQQYRRFLTGIMFMYFVVITILFAICCSLAIHGKPTLNQLFRSASYQVYYYILGSKGILEDYVYAQNNKTRTYTYITELWYGVCYWIYWHWQFVQN